MMPNLDDFYFKLGGFVIRAAPAILLAAVATATLTFVEVISQSAFGTSVFVRDDGSEDRITAMEKTINKLKSDLDGRDGLVNPMDSGRVVAIESKLFALEAALGDDVERAVSVAMMRRDLDDIGSDTTKRLDDLERRIESIFQLLLWISGSLITVLLAALGWLLSRRENTSARK